MGGPRIVHRLRTLAPLALAAALLLAACGGMNGATTPPAPRAEFLPARVDLRPGVDPFVAPGTIDLTIDAPRHWYVEVAARPLVDGGDRASVQAAVAQVRAAADAAGVDLRHRFTFGTFSTGFSAALDPTQVAALARVPGVVSVSPVGIIPAPEVTRHDPGSVTPQLFTALSMTGADAVQNELGFDGTGISVGIVDTGIMLEHPEFAGRIVAGFDFVGDLYDASSPLTDTPAGEGVGDPANVRAGGGDCNGHGTHVAGIVGAGGVSTTGVAPGVGLGAYRVFGCAGSTHSDVVLAAVERAFADGMDVVNLSLGSNNGWPQDFSSRSLSRMMDFGMVPVASAGNNGANGTWTIGAPGAGADVITVASVDNTDLTLASFTVAGQSIGYTVFDGSDEPPTTGTSAPISFAGLGCAAADFASFPSGDVALVDRGACTFGTKHANAVAAGASAVLIANNVAGPPVSGTLGGSFPGEAPAVGLSQADGATIAAQLGGAPVTLTWTDALISAPSGTGFLASSFSSYGLAPDLSLKPDLAAPGGFIYSTMIVGAEPGVAGTAGYETLSGTSMAAPHVAGAVALLLQARPDVPPHRMRDLLQNTALPVPWFGGQVVPGALLLESVHRQGAGLIDVAYAADSRTYASPAKLALGETADGPYVDVITIRNDSATSAVYALTQIEAFGELPVTTSGVSWQTPPTFGFAPPLVEYFELRDSGFFDPIDTIAVPAGGVASFQVRVTPNPDAPESTIQGTYLVFSPVVGGVGVTQILVPAAGYVGDYQALPTVAFGPQLVAVIDGGLSLVDEGWAYTMEGEDFPFFAVALFHGARTMTTEIVPLDPLRTWMGAQPAFEFDLVRRNNTSTLSAYGLGDFDASVLPNGAYRFRVTLLKAEGDPTNPAHYEVVESPVFYIDRTLSF